jgi:hypothetical protein
MRVRRVGANSRGDRRSTGALGSGHGVVMSWRSDLQVPSNITRDVELTSDITRDLYLATLRIQQNKKSQFS